MIGIASTSSSPVAAAHQQPPRPLARTAALVAGTIAVGLATRRVPHAFPSVIATYGGDVLWAAMVFWWLTLGWRRAGTLSLAAAALSIAWLVEASQRVQTEWLVRARATALGALALGQGFLWSDVWCYLGGVLAAAALDAMFRRGDLAAW